MLDGFSLATVDTGETTVRVRYGGGGPPLLRLHGIPETHLMWHKVAQRLATEFTVVATDLRGYRESGTPPSTPDHAPYSKRAMARDQVEVMRQLGFESFAVAGHDRGGRCAYRLALDHPERVRKLAVLDVIPAGEAFRRADMEFALGFWIWSFLAAPSPVPERLIAAAPDVFVDFMLDDWAKIPDSFASDARAEYHRAFRDSATIHAICEEYRAAATLDNEHDEADRGRRCISCPVLALWGAQGALPATYGDVLAVWREWADDVRGRGLDRGHFLPEEAPGETFARLRAFFAG